RQVVGSESVQSPYTSTLQVAVRHPTHQLSRRRGENEEHAHPVTIDQREMFCPGHFAMTFFLSDVGIDPNGVLAQIGNATLHGLALIKRFRPLVAQTTLATMAREHTPACVLLKKTAQDSQPVTHLENLLNVIIGQN